MKSLCFMSARIHITSDLEYKKTLFNLVIIFEVKQSAINMLIISKFIQLHIA